MIGMLTWKLAITPWAAALMALGVPGTGIPTAPCGPDGSVVRGTASFVLV